MSCCCCCYCWCSFHWLPLKADAVSGHFPAEPQFSVSDIYFIILKLTTHYTDSSRCNSASLCAGMCPRVWRKATKKMWRQKMKRNCFDNSEEGDSRFFFTFRSDSVAVDGAPCAAASCETMWTLNTEHGVRVVSSVHQRNYFHACGRRSSWSGKTETIKNCKLNWTTRNGIAADYTYEFVLLLISRLNSINLSSTRYAIPNFTCKNEKHTHTQYTTHNAQPNANECPKWIHLP